MNGRRLQHDRSLANGLAWAALALALLPSAALLVLPAYSTSTSADGPTGQVDTDSSATLLQHEGAAVLLLLAIPVALCLLGLNWPEWPLRRIDVIGK